MQKTLFITLTPEFLPGFQALIKSILRHTEKFNEQIICLDIGLSDGDRDFCKHLYSNMIFTKPVESNYVYRPTSAVALKNSFYKFEALRIAQEYDKTISIDCDIVFISSIKQLINVPLKADVRMAYHSKWREYNTGIMVIKKLKPAVYASFIDCMQSMKEAHLGDQTVMTHAIKRKLIKVAQLDNKWNTTKRQVKLYGYHNYCGLHFVGKKPWKGGEPGYEELEKVWQQYYQEG